MTLNFSCAYLLSLYTLQWNFCFCLCPFWIGFFSLLSFESSLYILCNSILLDMRFGNIFIILQGLLQSKINFDEVVYQLLWHQIISPTLDLNFFLFFKKFYYLILNTWPILSVLHIKVRFRSRINFCLCIANCSHMI